MREEMTERVGEVNVAVELIREGRDEGYNQHIKIF
jgi:hypothetical protein